MPKYSHSKRFGGGRAQNSIITRVLTHKSLAFTLAEILVVLGLIGTISAITIPNLAYNYRAKVLEEQYRSTYSEIKEIGSYLNYDKGDVGVYALKSNYATWAQEFMSKINGGNKLLDGANSTTNITGQLRDIYRQGGGSPGPYAFNLNGNSLRQVGIICDNYNIWLDSKGRIWTFNAENRIICVDINGTANPNRLNIDIFAFIPMNAQMVATWVYDDQDNMNNYSGQIVPCDLDYITMKGLSNKSPAKDEAGKYTKGDGTAFDGCPFFEPMENVAAINSTSPGKSARNRNVTRANNYWKDYINYK